MGSQSPKHTDRKAMAHSQYGNKSISCSPDDGYKIFNSDSDFSTLIVYPAGEINAKNQKFVVDFIPKLPFLPIRIHTWLLSTSELL
jgi:hypothetical protein